MPSAVRERFLMLQPGSFAEYLGPETKKGLADWEKGQKSKIWNLVFVQTWNDGSNIDLKILCVWLTFCWPNNFWANRTKRGVEGNQNRDPDTRAGEFCFLQVLSVLLKGLVFGVYDLRFWRTESCYSWNVLCFVRWLVPRPFIRP